VAIAISSALLTSSVRMCAACGRTMRAPQRRATQALQRRAADFLRSIGSFGQDRLSLVPERNLYDARSWSRAMASEASAQSTPVDGSQRALKVDARALLAQIAE
jgi:hypothetical protein